MDNNFVAVDNCTADSQEKGFLTKLGAFFKKAFNRLSRSLNEKRHCYLSFAVPIILLYITFICLGMYPFGTRAVLTLDMDGQYVYFFEQLRDVYTGDASIFYTFERGLGGEFLGYFTYYLASPLSLLVVLFPKTMITEAIMTMILLKTGLSGLTFSIYLGRTRKVNPIGISMFSVMYALCGFASLYQFNTMWHDAMIWLPLITLGIESLVKEGKFKLFVISLALAICSNYYLGYMLCIFVAIYFFFFIAAKPSDEINLLNESHHRLKSFIRIAIFSVIALMISAAVILSAYYSLQFGKTSYQDNPFDAEMRFDLLHLFSKLFAGSYDTVRPEGTANIYSGLFCLITVPIFYMSKKIKPREKILYTVLLTVFILSFCLNFIDLIWHGFQLPVWFNHRYSFMFSFIMLIMAYKGYEEIDETSTGFVGKVSAVLILMLLIIQKTVVLVRYENTGSEWEGFDTVPGYGMIWLSIGCILAFLVVLVVRKHTGFMELTEILLAVIIIIEVFVNTLISWAGVLDEGGCASRKNYRDYAEKIDTAYTEMIARDNSFYRSEHLFQRKLNDNLLGDFNGLTEFTSTFNASNVKFMERLGFYTSEPTISYISGNPVADSLLGVKYIIGSATEDTNGKLPGLNSASSLYSSYETKSGFVIYENPYALPIAYTVNRNMNKDLLEREFFEGNQSPFNSMNQLVSSMLGKDTQLFVPCYEYQNEGSTVSKSYDDEGGISFLKKSNSDKGQFVFKVTANYDGNVYMYLPSPYTTKASLYVGKSSSTSELIFSNMFQGETNRIIDLGSYKKGETITVKLVFTHYRIYLWDTEDYLVQVDPELLKQSTDTLKAGGLKIDEYSDTYISGTVNSAVDGTVFTTIPYDENWRVYVDGERVDIYELADSMVGFDISAGKHTVEIEYVHMPFIVGACISLVGIGILVLMCIFEKRLRKRFLVPDQEVLARKEQNETENGDSAQENESQTTKTEISEDNNDIPS